MPRLKNNKICTTLITLSEEKILEGTSCGYSLLQYQNVNIK
jgi:hypothetical protein